MKRQNISNIAIIVIFALLHFAVAIIGRMMDYHDDIPLTILTITMVIVVSMCNQTRIELMGILTLVCTTLGFLIGSWLWKPMGEILGNYTIAPAISTFIITILLGLLTHYITLSNKRFRNTGTTWQPSVRNIIIVALSILVIRLVYVALFRVEVFSEGMLYVTLSEIMSNSWAVILLITGNIVIMMRFQKWRNQGVVLMTWITAIVISTSLISYYDLPNMVSPAASPSELIILLPSALLLEILVFTICYLVQTTRISRLQLSRSEYQYERLKQQINPHFLFNSLNILDYLVQEQETERASTFIRKLANIYRYMLRNDEKPLVKIGEELDFTKMYIDLLRERFIEGLVFVIDVDESLYDKSIVPCSLQLLVENATKHNVVSAESPLTIKIKCDEEFITVSNNLQERTHGQPSTHLGLANIRRQYMDITRREIFVEKTENEFIVKLPII